MHQQSRFKKFNHLRMNVLKTLVSNRQKGNFVSI